MDLQKLKETIPYQWRVQSFSKSKPIATCVAYIDARDVMERLDVVCGPENWQSDFKDVGGQMFGGIGIYIEGAELLSGNRWVWKWDTGSESNVEAEKGQASDSFKRAAVKWGIGRFLYDLEIKTVKSNEVKKDGNFPHVVDDAGNRVWDLTKHLNGKTASAPTKPVAAKPVAKKTLTPPASVSLIEMQKAEIKTLCDGNGVVKLKTKAEYEEYVLAQTGLKLEVQNYSVIIERLKSLPQ